MSLSLDLEEFEVEFITREGPVAGAVLYLARAAGLGHSKGYPGCCDGVDIGRLSSICNWKEKLCDLDCLTWNFKLSGEKLWVIFYLLAVIGNLYSMCNNG